jgi:hypothetical protein
MLLFGEIKDVLLAMIFPNFYHLVNNTGFTPFSLSSHTHCSINGTLYDTGYVGIQLFLASKFYTD